MLASSIYGWHQNTVFTLKGEAAEVVLHSQAQLVYARVADIYALQLRLSLKIKSQSELKVFVDVRDSTTAARLTSERLFL
jgi:hypothetical protein